MPYPYYPQNTFQNFTQSMPQSIPGRMVNDQNEIMANDVPMDGNIAVFPSRTLDKIFVKQWSPNGSINTRIYSLEQPLKCEDSTNARLDDIKAKIGDLDARIADIESRLAKRKEAKE